MTPYLDTTLSQTESLGIAQRSSMNIVVGLFLSGLHTYAFLLAWPWLSSTAGGDVFWLMMVLGVVLSFGGLLTLFARVAPWELEGVIAPPSLWGSLSMVAGAVLFIGAGAEIDMAMKESWLIVAFSTVIAVGYAMLERSVLMSPEQDEYDDR